MAIKILEVINPKSTSNMEFFMFDEFNGEYNKELAGSMFKSISYRDVPGRLNDKFKSELAKTPKGTAWYEKSETGRCKLLAVNV
jgi:hypothetical protein